MNFEELSKVVESIRVNQANYQPIMIKVLLENCPNFVSKDVIAQALAKGNDSKDVSFFKRVPVYDVLTSKGIAIKKDGEFRLCSVLNHVQKAELIKVLKAKLRESEA